MKNIVCSGDRNDLIEKEIVLGQVRYRIQEDWAKWPEEMLGTQVMNSCWGGDVLYVATASKEYPVVLFDKGGNYLKSIGKGLFKKAHSMFVTAQGTLLIADANKNAHVIQEITTDGVLVRTFGNPGVPGDSGYNFDYLEVLEKENKQPTQSRWNTNAASNARIDSIVRRAEPFCRPCSMMQTADGEYYAADGYGNCAVHHFNRDGILVNSWGASGTEPGEFRVVHGVLEDRNNRIWVVDRENCRVQLFTRDGELLACTSGNLMRIGGICLDDQYLYIGELDGGLSLIDLDSLELVGQIGRPKSILRTHGITNDAQGNLYLSTNTWNGDRNLLKLEKI